MSQIIAGKLCGRSDPRGVAADPNRARRDIDDVGFPPAGHVIERERALVLLLVSSASNGWRWCGRQGAVASPLRSEQLRRAALGCRFSTHKSARAGSCVGAWPKSFSNFKVRLLEFDACRAGCEESFKKNIVLVTHHTIPLWLGYGPFQRAPTANEDERHTRRVQLKECSYDDRTFPICRDRGVA